MLRSETDDRRDLTARNRETIDEEGRKPREWIAPASEESHIAPGIEVLFHRQQENVRDAGALEQLGAIGVSIPTHVAEQFAIDGAKRDKVATAAMVRTENQLLRRELSERALDIERPKTRTIAAYGDDFVVTEASDCLDCIFEALGKTASGLAMNSWLGRARISGRREKVNVDRVGKFGGKFWKIQERPCRHRKRAPRKIDMRSLGEKENGASGHAFGYKTARPPDKSFSVGICLIASFDHIPQKVYRPDMKLSDLRAVLEKHPDTFPRFVLPNGDHIPPHAHVTEVGHVARNFIDCGGVTGMSETVLLQTHVGQDTDHRLKSDRFAKILQLGERVLPHDQLEVEVEYDCCVVAHYPVWEAKLAGQHLEVVLGNRHTQCLAQERARTQPEASCCGTAATCC